MANPEHLQILKQGVEAWNAWRVQNRDIGPNLLWANLRGAHLVTANLRGADLTNASLFEAALDSASLTKARLGGAVLTRAYFIDARLGGANLQGANLRGANLSSADLSGANLQGADLGGANLSQVVLYKTVFSNTDLTAVQGIETCRHHGPTPLDHLTLARSGPLPLAFLRGCGLPDTLIDYLPSLLNEPLQFLPRL